MSKKKDRDASLLRLALDLIKQDEKDAHDKLYKAWDDMVEAGEIIGKAIAIHKAATQAYLRESSRITEMQPRIASLEKALSKKEDVA